jgi:signal transduction histidine kinase
MTLSLRRRLFLALVALGTLPLTVALVTVTLQVRSAQSPAGSAAFEEIAESGRGLLATVDTTALSPEARAALRAHTDSIVAQTNLARRAATLSRYASTALAVGLLLVTAIVVAASLYLAQRWSRSVSAPVEELVEWVRRVERGEDLPEPQTAAAVPEVDRLRLALQEMAGALTRARAQELEQERLRAFRETARKVAHEMRGPLTATRLAVRRLGVAGDAEAAGVLVEETRRLEQMAKSFSEFGRLPEGPAADIDLGELLTSALQATVPEEVPIRQSVASSLVVRGHYEPLRRAFQNLLQNAVEAGGSGAVEVRAESGDTGVHVVVADSGPGIEPEQREHVFEPYFTTKERGTGLGLALVRQTILAHGGTIHAEESSSGGAAFVVTLPERS